MASRVNWFIPFVPFDPREASVVAACALRALQRDLALPPDPDRNRVYGSITLHIEVSAAWLVARLLNMCVVACVCARVRLCLFSGLAVGIQSG